MKELATTCNRDMIIPEVLRIIDSGITGYDVNASCDDLQKYLNDSLDNMIKAQIPPKHDEETEENNEENESDIEIETCSEVSTDETEATE